MEDNGRTFLESYGWPAPPHEPVHLFLAGADPLLEQARSDLADGEVPLDRAMLLLWGAGLQQGGPSGDDRQRTRVAELVAARVEELNTYVSRAEGFTTLSAQLP